MRILKNASIQPRFLNALSGLQLSIIALLVTVSFSGCGNQDHSKRTSNAGSVPVSAEKTTHEEAQDEDLAALLTDNSFCDYTSSCIDLVAQEEIRTFEYKPNAVSEIRIQLYRDHTYYATYNETIIDGTSEVELYGRKPYHTFFRGNWSFDGLNIVLEGLGEISAFGYINGKAPLHFAAKAGGPVNYRFALLEIKKAIVMQ
jgi:hypothetical protein